MNMDPMGAKPSGVALGVTLGTVSQTQDDKGLGRIKVKFKLTGQEIESDWLQIVSPYAGPDHGAFFLPQRDASVLLAFANGDASKPYVLGFVWNGSQPPPVAREKQQDVRLIKTKEGKTLSFDDSGEGGITLVDEEQNKIHIDTANNKISVESQGDLALTAKGKLTITASDVIIQNTDGTVQAVLSPTHFKIDGGSSLKLSATMIDLN